MKKRAAKYNKTQGADGANLLMAFRIDSELRAQIEEVAEQEERSVSQVIRRLLLRALAQNEKTA